MPWFSAWRTEHRAAVARRKQNVEQRFVVDLQAIIGHEDLDRAVALLDQIRQIFLQRLLVGSAMIMWKA
jgi:hypothetical protein